MYIDRPALKRQAKNLISTSKPQPIVVGLVYVLLILLVSWLSGKMSGLDFSTNELIEYSNYITQGDVDSALYLIENHVPSSGMRFVGLLLNIISEVLSAGFIIFLLNTIRMQAACFGNLLDGFGMFFRIIWLDILQTVFVTLWSLLLVVPGIIAAYRYRLALYLLLDHPEMSAMDCIRESKRIMSGNKGQLFVLDLSFIGWLILEGIPIIGLLVRVWVVPYTQMTYALYYTTLTGTNAPGAIPGDGGAQDEPHEEHPWEN